MGVLRTTSTVSSLRSFSLFPTLADRYFEDLAANRITSAATRKSKASVLRLLQRCYPDKRVVQYSEDDLVDFLRSSGVAPATIRKYRNDIVAFFEWAEFRGYVARSPAANLKRLVRPKAAATKVHHWLGREQVARLLATCSHRRSLRTERDYVLMTMALFTGLRKSELVRVRWCDVDLVNRVIYVVGKGDKPAQVGIPSPLHEALTSWRRQYAIGLGRPPADEPILIRFRHSGGAASASERRTEPGWGEATTGNMVALRIQALGRDIGIEYLAPHDLRRTFAGLLQTSGTPLKEIQLAMRHENLSTTDVYLSKNQQRAFDAVDKMAEGF